MNDVRGSAQDPAFRRERARQAALASHSTDALVRRFVRRVHELTPDQVAEVRKALQVAEEAETDA